MNTNENAEYVSVDLNSLQIRMARSENLPVLPQAVSQMLKLADDPNSSQRDIERAFEKDPAITAKILKAANSPFYGGSNSTTISRAVAFLGMSVIKSLVISVAFQQTVGNKSQVRSFDKVAYWRHSLATGTAARILGKLKLPARSEELYCAGIMHDIGMLVMEKFLPSQFEEAINRSNGLRVPLHKCERDILGYDHASVGGLLAERWGLNEMFTSAVANHHNPQADYKFYDTTSIIEQADALAHSCNFGNHGFRVEHTVEELSLLTSLPVEQIPIIQQVICSEIQKSDESFQLAS
ncbi:HDOD domain-containing protein [Kamptonema cortianum]|nr:HDOD domain-containing protein [Kamptonema cortianum]